MDFFIYLALQTLAWATQKLPKSNPRKYSLSEFEFPTATEDRAPSVVFGTVRVAGNVLWAGDYKANEVKKKVRLNPIKTAYQTVGYRYRVGLWLSLTGCPIDALLEFRVGDKVAWSGESLLDQATLGVREIPVSATFKSQEGEELSDGVEGVLTVIRHKERTEPFPWFRPSNLSYLAQQVDAKYPIYPNTTQILWKGPSAWDTADLSSLPTWAQGLLTSNKGFVGIGPNIAPWTFTVRRMPAWDRWLPSTRTVAFDFGSLGRTAWLNDRVNIGGDANPAFVLAELLTSHFANLNGPRLFANAIDAESFLAAADRLKTEGNGVSFEYASANKLGDTVKEVLAQIDGVLEVSERTGRLVLRLIRETDAPVLEFDASNTLAIESFSRVALDSAPNEVKVPFSDRAAGFIERVATAQNTAAFARAGATLSQERRYIGVSNATLAQQLATREMRKLSTSLARVRFSAVLPPATVLKPGSLITLDHADLGQVLRLRVQTVRYGDYTKRTEVEIEAMEDVWRAGTANGVYTIPPSQLTVLQPPTALVSPQVIVAPRALTGTDYDRLLYIAEAEDARTLRLQAVIKENATAWADLVEPIYQADKTLPAISGTLATAVGALSAAPTLTVNLSAAAVQAFKTYGSSTGYYAIAGGEWLYVNSAVLDAANNRVFLSVNRGALDTNPVDLAAGIKVLLLLDYALDEAQVRTLGGNGGATVSGLDLAVLRADSIGAGGTLEAANAAGSTASWAYTAANSRALRPVSPAAVVLQGASGAIVGAAATNIGRSASLSLTWANRNRLSPRVEDWYAASNAYEANQSTTYAVYYETTDGSGNYTPLGTSTNTAVGANTATISTAGVPAGARRLRVDIVATRPGLNGQFISSVERSYYWRLNA